ncbi:PREDICTED: epididymal secretory protein E3-beta-like [Chrysochloris asiatica]|uniref:Epididymal secretory protein E3-beta-like n=1 Tax=Chrysochloris asiatica TaxID=185453 RepID=A0A9B0WJ72_CHRAS|nr:PREDICTED: epididymal secretory protein E3-beta-like [Chrysochloris asiatica]
MASYLKALGPVLVLLSPLWGQLIEDQNHSRKEFMKQHHLSPALEFNQYKCNILMKKLQSVRNKASHIFLYAPWYQIDNICFNNWVERHKNVYIWGHQAFKVLKCSRKNNKSNYRETRSYSHIKFHCGTNGFVDRMRDMNVLQIIPT